MNARSSDTRALIEAHIRAHGVTRCPTVALESLQATIPADDAAAIRTHDALRYEADHSLDERARRNARNLLRTSNAAAMARRREGRR